MEERKPSRDKKVREKTCRPTLSTLSTNNMECINSITSSNGNCTESQQESSNKNNAIKSEQMETQHKACTRKKHTPTVQKQYTQDIKNKLCKCKVRPEEKKNASDSGFSRVASVKNGIDNASKKEDISNSCLTNFTLPVSKNTIDNEDKTNSSGHTILSNLLCPQTFTTGGKEHAIDDENEDEDENDTHFTNNTDNSENAFSSLWNSSRHTGNIYSSNDTVPSRNANQEGSSFFQLGSDNHSSNSLSRNRLYSFFRPFLINDSSLGPVERIFYAEDESDMKLLHILRYIKACDRELNLLWNFVCEHAELFYEERSLPHTTVHREESDDEEREDFLSSVAVDVSDIEADGGRSSEDQNCDYFICHECLEKYDDGVKDDEEEEEEEEGNNVTDYRVQVEYQILDQEADNEHESIINMFEDDKDVCFENCKKQSDSEEIIRMKERCEETNEKYSTESDTDIGTASDLDGAYPYDDISEASREENKEKEYYDDEIIRVKGRCEETNEKCSTESDTDIGTASDLDDGYLYEDTSEASHEEKKEKENYDEEIIRLKGRCEETKEKLSTSTESDTDTGTASDLHGGYPYEDIAEASHEQCDNNHLYEKEHNENDGGIEDFSFEGEYTSNRRVRSISMSIISDLFSNFTLSNISTSDDEVNDDDDDDVEYPFLWENNAVKLVSIGIQTEGSGLCNKHNNIVHKMKNQTWKQRKLCGMKIKQPQKKVCKKFKNRRYKGITYCYNPKVKDETDDHFNKKDDKVTGTVSEERPNVIPICDAGNPVDLCRHTDEQHRTDSLECDSIMVCDVNVFDGDILQEMTLNCTEEKNIGKELTGNEKVLDMIATITGIHDKMDGNVPLNHNLHQIILQNSHLLHKYQSIDKKAEVSLTKKIFHEEKQLMKETEGASQESVIEKNLLGKVSCTEYNDDQKEEMKKTECPTWKKLVHLESPSKWIPDITVGDNISSTTGNHSENQEEKQLMKKTGGASQESVTEKNLLEEVSCTDDQKEETKKTECPILKKLVHLESPFKWVPDITVGDNISSTTGGHSENLINILTEKKKEFSRMKQNVFREIVIYLVLIYEKTLRRKFMDAEADLQHCYNILGNPKMTALWRETELDIGGHIDPVAPDGHPIIKPIPVSEDDMLSSNSEDVICGQVLPDVQLNESSLDKENKLKNECSKTEVGNALKETNIMEVHVKPEDFNDICPDFNNDTKHVDSCASFYAGKASSGSLEIITLLEDTLLSKKDKVYTSELDNSNMNSNQIKEGNDDGYTAHKVIDISIENAENKNSDEENECEKQAQRKAALQYVVTGTQAYIAYFKENYCEAYKLAKYVENQYEQMGNIGKATVAAIKGAVLMEYGHAGNKLAQEFLEKALELDPEHWEWNLYCSKILGRLRRSETLGCGEPGEKELSLLQKAVQLNRKDASCLVHLAIAYRCLSNAKYMKKLEARSKENSAVETRPYVHKGGNNNWKTNRPPFCYSQQKQESIDSIEKWRNPQQISLTSPMIPLELDQHYYLNLAKELFLEALDKEPHCPYNNARCAKGLWSMPYPYRDRDRAQEAIIHALTTAPHDSLVNFYAGLFYEFCHDYEKAMECYGRAFSHSNLNFSAEMNYINLMLKMNPSESYSPMIHLDSLLSKYPTNFNRQQTLCAMGFYLYKVEKQHLSAIHAIFEGIKLNPRSHILKKFYPWNVFGRSPPSYNIFDLFEEMFKEHKKLPDFQENIRCAEEMLATVMKLKEENCEQQNVNESN